METKKIRDKIRDNLHPDKLSCSKDGVWLIQFGYFYRHGRSCEKYVEKIRELFQGMTVDITGAQDAWAAWPRNSFFKVWFKIS